MTSPTEAANKPDYSLQPDRLRKRLEKAQKLLLQKRYRETAELLNELQKVDPRDARIFLVGAILAEKTGHPEQAVATFEKAIALAPDWTPARLEYALLLARLNRFAPAIEAARWARNMESANPIVIAGCIDIAHRCGALSLAIEWLRDALKRFPGDVQLQFALAQDLYAMGEYPEALQFLEQVVNAGQADKVDVRLLRAKLHLAMGQSEVARADLAQVLTLEPKNAEAQMLQQVAAGEQFDRQPAAVVADLFDAMAGVYDVRMVHGLGYVLPEWAARQIVSWYPQRDCHVLDLGCGTGLLGACLGPIRGALVGVDLSDRMIDEAIKRKAYDKFHRVDIHDALQATPDAQYHVIAALDVFIYAGAVDEALRHMQRILVPGGGVIVSFEALTGAEQGPMQWRSTGRFVHRAEAVEAAANAAGLEQVHLEKMTIRTEAGQPVEGFVLTGRRPSA